jgi:hypothetical protein
MERGARNRNPEPETAYNPQMRHAPARALAAAVIAIAGASAYAQFGRGFLFAPRTATAEDFDGRFHYCRVAYPSAPDGEGGSWRTDYPNADINFSIRLSELTKTRVSRHPSGEPRPLIVRLRDETLFGCPLVILSAPGAALIEEADATRLREYLLKGGMLWADDFWGTYQWDHWVAQLRKALPADQHAIVDVPLDHPVFRTQFEVKEIPQIPNIGFFLRSGGGTSERGADSAVPHMRAVMDDRGRIMVLMTHNTDIADAWEREGEDPTYFYTFSPRGYAVGINVALYAMTH